MNRLKTGRAILAPALTGITGCIVIFRMLARYGAGWIPPYMMWILSILILPAVLIYVILRAKRNKELSAPLNMVLVILLAFDLYSFGWQKIFHLQMVVPLGMLDLPFNSLDGETLTWAYFRRSYPFTVAIAIAQISGAILLLFRRTRLLGLIMLVPVLLNIILIDIFYHLHAWVLFHALVLMSGIVYLLFQYKTELIAFFFNASSRILSFRIHKSLYIIIPGLPLVLLLTYRFPDRHPQFTGKYKVNGPQPVTSFRDSILTTIYMDLQDDIVLEFNHYNNRYIGTYKYDPQTRRIHAKWRYPVDAALRFDGILTPLDEQHNFQFSGVLGEDSIHMQLIYVPERK